jgi:hypothetical protein
MSVKHRQTAFSRVTTTVVPISRVRIVPHVDRVSRARNGWDVDYLPAGKSRWWWNWRTYRRERTEETARLLADVLIAERAVTLTGYENTEVEV